jgi:hypothetical protein
VKKSGVSQSSLSGRLNTVGNQCGRLMMQHQRIEKGPNQQWSEHVVKVHQYTSQASITYVGVSRHELIHASLRSR